MSKNSSAEPPRYEPPSYEESVGSHQTSQSASSKFVADGQKSDAHRDHGPAFQDAGTTTQSFTVDPLFQDHLYVALEASLSRGQSSTTLILVPQNKSALHPVTASTKGGEYEIPSGKIVGIPKDRTPLMVRLEMEEHSLEYLRQPAVVQQVVNELCHYLASKGCRKIAVDPDQIWTVESGSQSASEFQRNAANARIHARIETACVRVETDMGLYETRSGKCLMIDVDVYEQGINVDLYLSGIKS